MTSTTQEKAVRAQTATGIPPTIESLSQEINEESRSRRGSASSFFSVFSDASSIGTTSTGSRPVTPVSKIDKIVESMKTHLSTMEKATEKQKNISKDVKEGLKALRSLLAELQSAREEARKTTTAIRASKRLRNPEDSPEALAEAKKKKIPSSGSEPPTIQVTHDNGASFESRPGTSKESGQLPPGWKTVESRKKHNKKTKKNKKKDEGTTAMNSGQGQGSTAWITGPAGNAPKKRGAVLIVPKDGKTFADVVRTIRTVDTSDSNFVVRGVSKTRDGAVLVRTTGGGRTEDLSGRLREALGDHGVVKDMTSKITLEVLDLDCVTVTDEVKDALNKVLGTNADRKVSVLGPNSRGQKLAICDLNGQDATKLLQTGRIKIGFVSCRVRARLMVPRCFKCLGYGHYRADCTGPDRRDCCWRCGGAGHKAGTCTGSPVCFLCSSQGGEGAAHVPGTARCAAFKAALTETRARQRTTRT